VRKAGATGISETGWRVIQRAEERGVVARHLQPPPERCPEVEVDPFPLALLMKKRKCFRIVRPDSGGRKEQRTIKSLMGPTEFAWSRPLECGHVCRLHEQGHERLGDGQPERLGRRALS